MSSDALVPRQSASTPSCRTIVRTPSSVEPYACTPAADRAASVADFAAAEGPGLAIGQACVGQLVMAHRLRLPLQSQYFDGMSSADRLASSDWHHPRTREPCLTPLVGP